MIRSLDSEDARLAHALWRRRALVIVREALEAQTPSTQQFIRDLGAEVRALEAVAPSLFPNPHSVYKQVQPEFLLRTPRASLVPSGDRANWAVLDCYEQPSLLQLVEQVTGWPRAHRIPLSTTKGFEINGKLNFYDARESSRLDWHFDKVFNLRGRQVVCVLTLQNDWDALPEPQRPRTLQVQLPGLLATQGLYLGGNSLSMHDPDAVFHRVLPFTAPPEHAGKPWRRSVLVMRFTDDPTPVAPLLQTLGATRYLARQALHFAAVGDVKWVALSALCLAVLVLCISRVRAVWKSLRKQ